MAATVLRYREGNICQPNNSAPLGEVLFEYECTPQRLIDTYPCEADMNHLLSECWEQTKALLLNGELDTFFHLAAHADVHFRRLWDEDIYANGAGLGLRKLMEAMSQACLCFNVLVVKPELWDAESRRAYLKAEKSAHRTTFECSSFDHRLTSAYQRTVVCCTGIPYGPYYHEAHTYPHREFFGVPRGMFRSDDPYQGQKTGKQWPVALCVGIAAQSTLRTAACQHPALLNHRVIDPHLYENHRSFELHANAELELTMI
jgi:hypothetical protein